MIVLSKEQVIALHAMLIEVFGESKKRACPYMIFHDMGRLILE